MPSDREEGRSGGFYEIVTCDSSQGRKSPEWAEQLAG